MVDDERIVDGFRLGHIMTKTVRYGINSMGDEFFTITTRTDESVVTATTARRGFGCTITEQG